MADEVALNTNDNDHSKMYTHLHLTTVYCQGNGYNVCSHNLLNTTHEHPDDVSVIYILISAVSMCIAIAIIVCNGVVFMCVMKIHNSEEVSRLFLLQHALLNMFTGVLILYIMVYNLVLYKNIYECAFRNGSICGVFVGTGLVILGMTVHRYTQIALPLRYTNIIQLSTVKLYVVLIWLVVLVVSIAPLLTWIDQDPDVAVCAFFIVLNRPFVCTLSGIIFTSLSLQFIMYIHIFGIAINKIRIDRMLIRTMPTLNTRSTIYSWWKPSKPLLLIAGVNFVMFSPLGECSFIHILIL